MAYDLDDVDREILHALQANAREVTAAEMAELVGVAASTVRNRIGRLESEDVIRGYHPEVDYERAGFPIHAVLVCDARQSDDPAFVESVLNLPQAVCVRELLSSDANLHVEVVAADATSVDAVVEDLTDMGVDVVQTNIVTRRTVRPFDGFDPEGSKRPD